MDSSSLFELPKRATKSKRLGKKKAAHKKKEAISLFLTKKSGFGCLSW
jgi:hypothetical protein